MGFRFRKSFKLAPGVRINVGSRGVSLSALGTNFSSRGISSGFSIPGTGISYRANLSTSARKQERVKTRIADLQAQQARAEKLLAERRRKLSSIRITLDDEDVLTMMDADGDRLSAADETLVWKQDGARLTDMLQRGIRYIEGDSRLIADIHLDTMNPKAAAAKEPFDEPRPALRYAPPLTWWRRLFGLRRRCERLSHEAAREHAEALRQWRVPHDEHEAAQNRAREAHVHKLRTNRALMEATLETSLAQLAWPRETLVSLDFTDGGAAGFLDVDLPEIKDLPKRTAALAKGGRRLVVKDKSERALRAEYARHIHGVAFRLAGAVFSSLPGLERVVVSGFSQRLNKATGQITDDYLFSVDIEWSRFSQINISNLSAVDPVEALALFKIRRKMSSTGVFQPVLPIAPESGIRLNS